MKKTSTAILICLICSGAAFGGQLPPNPDGSSAGGLAAVPNEVLVSFRPGVGRGAIRAARRNLGATEIRVFTQIGVRHWRVPPGLGVARAVQILSRNPNVRFAEPNHILHIDSMPNDPRRGDLWGLHNTGQTGGTADADIDAPEAWGLQTGSANVVVAVIDTGIDCLHEDLAANIWVNQVEAQGTEGVDDDGNGFVDDITGWDFVNDDNDPMDDNGHGSHTAGTIGAVGDNGIGVAGVNWSVRLMPLKAFDAAGNGATTDAIEAILYAASFEVGGNKIVRITNNSWGGERRSRALQDAIANSGALFVASAGNNGDSKKQYPAAYDLDNIISVAAMDHNGALASFSSFGSDWVDVAAPGVDILSTIPLDGYGTKSGTSMAAPHVAGVAALMMAHFPDWDDSRIKADLLAAVDVTPALTGTVLSNGCINAFSALGGTEPGPPDTTAPDHVNDLTVTGTTSDTVALTWTATGDDALDGTAFAYDVRYATTPITDDAGFADAAAAQGEPLPSGPGTLEVFTVTGLSPETTYDLALKVSDEAGNLSELSNVVSASTDSPPPGAWRAQTVASEGDVGFHHDLAFDPADGNPSIAFSDESLGLVKFAHWNGSSWDVETVDRASGDIGVSIAYDGGGMPTMSYNAAGNLRLARKTESGWQSESIDARLPSFSVTSLAYDLSLPGNPGISYRVRSKGTMDMMFAHWSGTSWEVECIEPGRGHGASSVAYDPDGNPAIAYGNTFAHWNGTSWDTDVYEQGPVYDCSLVYSPDGNPTIACVVGEIVRFVCWNGESWIGETIDRGVFCSHACDASGTPFIGYHDESGDTAVVKVARGTWEASAETWHWDIEIVDAVDLTWGVSTAVDPAGNPSVCYGEWSNRDLRFATKAPQP